MGNIRIRINKKNMKKVDLSKLIVSNVDGSKREHNLAKELSQYIYQTTQSIAELSFAMDLHKNPIVELTEENKEIIKKYVETGFLAFIKIAVNELFQEDEKE